jgi:hypothetical protein
MTGFLGGMTVMAENFMSKEHTETMARESVMGQVPPDRLDEYERGAAPRLGGRNYQNASHEVKLIRNAIETAF